MSWANLLWSQVVMEQRLAESWPLSDAVMPDAASCQYQQNQQEQAITKTEVPETSGEEGEFSILESFAVLEL